MRGFEIVAVVIGVFFLVGIVVGMLLVVALPLLRSIVRRRRNGRGYMDGGDWRELPPTHEDDEKPPRWPSN
jgi:MFS superfamily sulfate permease-like transporter